MRWLALGLLTACACTPQPIVSQPADAANSLVPAASAPAASAGFVERPTPAPAGERVSRVPIAIFGYEALAGPDVVEAQPPSGAFPEGTVYSAMYHSAYDSKQRVREAPYLYEWDVARAEVVRHATSTVSVLVGAPPRIDFDGTHVAMLAQQLDEETGKLWARLDVYDRQLAHVRGRRLVTGDAIALGAHGDVAVVSSVQRDVIELFDAQLRLKATSHVRVVFGGLGPAKALWHAGDSFYLVAHTSPGHVAVLRLHERTLRETGRSEELPASTEESTASLTKTEDGWVLIADERMVRVDAALQLAPVGTVDVLSSPPYAWHGGHALSIAATATGSSVFNQCTPHWVFGQPLFACAAPDEITMVRPVLTPGWTPLQATK